VVAWSPNGRNSDRNVIPRVLTLDGGGAKGFYTLGVLREIEGLVGMRLHQKFDLIFGTSASLLRGGFP
jgi:uncharacterized protein